MLTVKHWQEYVFGSLKHVQPMLVVLVLDPVVFAVDLPLEFVGHLAVGQQDIEIWCLDEEMALSSLKSQNVNQFKCRNNSYSLYKFTCIKFVTRQITWWDCKYQIELKYQIIDSVICSCNSNELMNGVQLEDDRIVFDNLFSRDVRGAQFQIL